MSNYNYINSQKNRQLKKTVVEIGLIAIKLLLLVKSVLASVIKFLANLFRFFFKLFFYRILVKIYYGIFRLKNNDNIQNSPDKILREKSAIFFVLILATILIFSNVVEKTRANALENNISGTIMANLITRDFNNIDTEELIEETADLDSLLIFYKENYIDESYSLNKENILNTGGDDENTDQLMFANNQDAIIKPKTITTDLNIDGASPKRTKIVYYTIASGDTVSTIAREFGISVNTVLWANNLSSFSLIRPDNKLTILPESGILYTVKSGDSLARIANTYGISENDIRENNDLGRVLKIGESLMLPGAKKVVVAIASKPSYTGISVIKDLVKAPDIQASSNKMAWPTVGHRITQYFSWRHSGLDIGNKTGTPLYAADAGKVTYSGWSTGYGYNILIDHGGGKETRYAHASKLFVKVGDLVDKGENIAAMGSTGWSTGPHIHFEVIINGTKYNPLNYIK